MIAHIVLCIFSKTCRNAIKRFFGRYQRDACDSNKSTTIKAQSAMQEQILYLSIVSLRSMHLLFSCALAISLYDVIMMSCTINTFATRGRHMMICFKN